MSRPISIRFVLILTTAASCALAGCGLQKPSQQTEILKTEDFIVDPATLPTGATSPADIASSPALKTPPTISAAAASDGVLNVSAVPGAPAESGNATKAAGPMVLVDAKIGELNGRPVRADQVLDELAPLLAAKARDRKLTRDEWAFMLQGEPPRDAENRTLTREQWLGFAQRAISFRLSKQLEDQLLAEEARFSLKPEQKAGLKYLVQEATETARREAGSRAASQNALKQRGTSEREATKERESTYLIQYELYEKLNRRIRTSWKDVRLYYERNRAEFNPPPIAHFRQILVPANKPDDVAIIQAALDAGEPFEKAAARPQNTYRASDGGRTPDKQFDGDYEKASFFSGTLGDAAHSLTPGQFTKAPVDSVSDKAWLSLESIERHNRPLSDPEVQLIIANRLNSRAFEIEKANYIERLKQRATFTDIPSMTLELADIAAARYWPKE